MSGAFVASGGGAAAAAAAAAKAKKMREEEEELTPYHAEDLDGWEFKIIRANTRKFKTAEAVRKLCAEEAQAGWEMVEKFDDSRIRFKRRVQERSQDPHRQTGIDPYRAQIGVSEAQIVLIVLGLSALIALGVFLLAQYVD
jgi:hypothetical protein